MDIPKSLKRDLIPKKKTGKMIHWKAPAVKNVYSRKNLQALIQSVEGFWLKNFVKRIESGGKGKYSKSPANRFRGVHGRKSRKSAILGLLEAGEGVLVGGEQP